MIIKASSRKTIERIHLFGISVPLCWGSLLAGMWNSDVFVFICVSFMAVILSLIYLILIILCCKTIILSIEGCEIIYGSIKKHYSWDDINCKRWIDFPPSQNKWVPKGCYLFAKTKSPLRLNARHIQLSTEFTELMHPLSCFRILPETNALKKFIDVNHHRLNESESLFSSINETEFRDFIENIQLEIDNMHA